MTSPTEFARLKEAVDAKKTAADKAAGAFDAALADFKKRFGVSTIEEAKKKLAELEATEERARKIYNAEFERFKEEWKSVFGEIPSTD